MEPRFFLLLLLFIKNNIYINYYTGAYLLELISP